MPNLDLATVDDFGAEWARFDQARLTAEELEQRFVDYFGIFPWHVLPAGAVGFELGCGSGRWARPVAARVGHLHCIDASSEAIAVARRNLQNVSNCQLHHASVDDMPLADTSMDFGYSLGVLHHVPDPLAGLRSCVQKLKPGAPFLLYLYYSFDNRPIWYQRIWRVTDLARRVLSRTPRAIKHIVAEVIAGMVYWPLARAARELEKRGRDVRNIPLSYYRNFDFYTMRTDALDRFGTRVEQRYSRAQIADMMQRAGLVDITFSQSLPYWCAVGYRTVAVDASALDQSAEEITISA